MTPRLTPTRPLPRRCAAIVLLAAAAGLAWPSLATADIGSPTQPPGPEGCVGGPGCVQAPLGTLPNGEA